MHQALVFTRENVLILINKCRAMKEFMLLVRNAGDAKAGMSPEQHVNFVSDCKVYIEKLQKKGNLISAQPLVREGVMLSGTPGNWKLAPYNENEEVQVGYYHILAKDIDEAIAIAKDNPEFAYHEHAKIEVRPIKMKEEAIAYTYPNS
jgi:hypothetical protein